MAKKYPVNRIKTHRIYNVREAAEALGAHVVTVRRWVAKEGLPADTARKPWLIEGKALRAFLGERQVKRRIKTALHHCYCLGCRSPREPDGKMADYIQLTTETGRLEGLCPVCGNLMNKVVRRVDLEAIRAKIEVTVQRANPRLVSRSETHSNVTFSKGSQNYGKARNG